MKIEDSDFIFKEESYQIIGICMKVHQTLGRGFQEVVYKDALDIEFNNAGLYYRRESRFAITYVSQILQHRFIADFVINDVILLEIKSTPQLQYQHFAQTLNYLKASKIKVGLLINFGESSLNFKRVICTY